MLIIISPSQTLDFETSVPPIETSQPAFLDQAATLMAALQRYDPAALAELMSLSPALTTQVQQYHAAWQRDHRLDNARPALLAFGGVVYNGLQAQSLSVAQLDFAQAHLRILSGLYGVLRPLDLIQAYRLELKTKLAVGSTKNLYAFWGTQITEALNDTLSRIDSPVLINLASREYARAVKEKQLQAPMLTIEFKERKNGQLRSIAHFAKYARGLMAGYIIRHGLQTPATLKAFAEDGYTFDPDQSNDSTWVFSREQP